MSIVFYSDCDLGKNIFPGILRDAGIHVERHLDHFPGDAPDSEWIPYVADQGWYALTNDRRIYRTPAEREAVIRSGLKLFVLSGGHAPTKELAQNFILTYKKVTRFIERTDRPFIASVTRSTKSNQAGNVYLRYPKDR
ncbi:MAG: hypothetical protein WD423_04225 [Rhodothermales bacterium]